MYLFERQRKKEIFIPWFTPQMTAISGDGQKEVRSLALHLSFSCRWQRPKYLSHLLMLSQEYQYRGELEAELPGLEMVLIMEWNHRCKLNSLHHNTGPIFLYFKNRSFSENDAQSNVRVKGSGKNQAPAESIIFLHITTVTVQSKWAVLHGVLQCTTHSCLGQAAPNKLQYDS